MTLNKMKIFYKCLLFIILTFYSCEKSQKKSEVNSMNEIKPDISVFKSDSTNQYFEGIFNDPIDIDSFLTYTKISINSGVCQHDKIYFKPSEIGYYYQAYWFSSMDDLIFDADTTPTNNTDKSIYLLLFKVGKDTKEFKTQKSYPIYIFTRIDDNLLGRINFVGKDWNHLKSKFPENGEIIENIITFQSNNKILSFEINDDIITAVLFVHFQTKPDTNDVLSFFKNK